MKRTIMTALAGLTLVAACSDTLTLPTESESGGRLAPQGIRKDDIVNELDATIDAVAEVMSLNAGGANGTTTLYVQPRNGDGKNGCNLQGSESVTVNVLSSDPAVATVSPSSVTLTACPGTTALTITPLTEGTTSISLSAPTFNNSGGSFNRAPATFTVTVAAPANSAPTVSIKGVEAGAEYEKGSVPAATCDVKDAEDGTPAVAPVLGDITGPYAEDGIGTQEVSCSYTDKGGLEDSDSFSYSIVDPSPPSIGYTLSPVAPDGSGGWYKSSVTLTWNVSDAQSPLSLQKTGCMNQSITTDQLETTYSCSATSAGGLAGPVEVKIKRDATAPNVAYTSAAPATPDGSNGWYVSNVTATFTATDAISAVNGSTTAQVATSSEGASVTVSSPAFSDNAGNTTAAGAATSPAFQIDLTDPSNVAFAGGPANGSSHYFGSVPAAPTCTATDAVSGLAGCVVTGYNSAVGTHTLTATATDNAGRTATATRSYTVLAWTLNGFYQPVDMNGVTNSVKSGSTVPFKFEVFAGTTELTDVAVVKSFVTTPVACITLTSATDDIESTTTGGTSLRYDLTAGQFIQNWQTTGKAGACYKVTMTTQDLSTLTAFFKLK